MKKIIQYFSWIFGLIIALSAIVIIWQTIDRRQTDGFKPSKILTQLPYSSEWDVGRNEDGLRLLDSLLDQSFYYLGKGRQSYAFLSQDGQYVLKFFKQNRLSLPTWFTHIYLPSFLDKWRQQKIDLRKKRVKAYFESTLIAYKEMPEETGVLFIHLVPKNEVHKPAILFDRSNNRYEVDIEYTSFILQQKATWIHPLIEDLMQRGMEIEAEKRIDQVIDLFKQRSKKGIVDEDSSVAVRNNIGFLEDRCIFIDIGTFRHSRNIQTKKGFQKDLRRLEPFYEWLYKKYPHLATYYRKRSSQTIEEF